MPVAAACLALIALVSLQDPPPGRDSGQPRPAQDAAPPATVASGGTGVARNEGTSRAEDRASKEAKLLAELVPAPMAEERVRAIARGFSIAPDSASAVDAALAQYAAQTADAHRRATVAARSRLGAGFRSAPSTGSLEPQPGPELAALLVAGGDWRRTLAAADDALFRQLASMRSPESPRCPGHAAWERTSERDDAPAEDPGAALRLPALIDAAQLAPADRARVESALDRQWSAVAAAIAARRLAIVDAEVERARLFEQWGAGWQLTAPAEVAEERLRAVERLSARARAAEVPLREANRAAAMALLRLLPADAAERVRDASDRALWPWIFEAERSVAESVRKAGELGGPALADPLDAMLRDLSQRLTSSRRELARRASAAEELEAIVAVAEAGAPPAELIASLEARIRLHELLARRLRLVTESTLLMQQAASGDPRTKAILDERVESLRSLGRALKWEQQGLLARIAELGAPMASEPPE